MFVVSFGYETIGMRVITKNGKTFEPKALEFGSGSETCPYRTDAKSVYVKYYAATTRLCTLSAHIEWYGWAEYKNGHKWFAKPHKQKSFQPNNSEFVG